MMKIFYLLFVYINLAMFGCCFLGLYQSITMYGQHLQIMIGSIAYDVHKKTPCPIVLVSVLSYNQLAYFLLDSCKSAFIATTISFSLNCTSVALLQLQVFHIFSSHFPAVNIVVLEVSDVWLTVRRNSV